MKSGWNFSIFKGFFYANRHPRQNKCMLSIAYFNQAEFTSLKLAFFEDVIEITVLRKLQTSILWDANFLWRKKSVKFYQYLNTFHSTSTDSIHFWDRYSITQFSYPLKILPVPLHHILILHLLIFERKITIFCNTITLILLAKLFAFSKVLRHYDTMRQLWKMNLKHAIWWTLYFVKTNLFRLR